MAFFKKRTKENVVGKETFSRSEKKNGKPRKSGTIVRFADGTSTVLLTPSGKGEKYAAELKSGVRMTNDGVPKTGRDGFVLGLTSEQKAYRGGYLDAQKDNAKAYKAKTK